MDEDFVDFVLWCAFLEKWQESLIFFEKKRIEQKVMEGFNNLFKSQKIDKNTQNHRKILISRKPGEEDRQK